MSPKALDEPTPLSAKVSLTIGRRLVLYVYLVTSLFFCYKIMCLRMVSFRLSIHSRHQEILEKGKLCYIQNNATVEVEVYNIQHSDVDVVTISICTLPGFHSVFEHDGLVSSLPEEFQSRSRRSASPPSSSSLFPFVPS